MAVMMTSSLPTASSMRMRVAFSRRVSAVGRVIPSSRTSKSRSPRCAFGSAHARASLISSSSVIAHVLLIGRRIPSDQTFIHMSPDERISSLAAFGSRSSGSGVRSWSKMRMPVHWRHLVQGHCAVVKLVQMGVASLVDVGPRGSFNLYKNLFSFPNFSLFNYFLTFGEMIPGNSLVGSMSKSTSTPEL